MKEIIQAALECAYRADYFADTGKLLLFQLDVTSRQDLKEVEGLTIEQAEHLACLLPEWP